MHWYYVPTALLRIYPSVTDLCCRGCGQRGTLLRLWWECPVICPLWSDIKDQINVVLDVDIPLSPVHFLLHIRTLLHSHYKQSALPHLLKAAKRLIPIYWKRAQAPNRKEWIRKVNEIMEAVEWVATCKDRWERFSSIWATGQEHTFDPAQIPSR